MTTLFLDRDGVINVRIPGEYVRTPEEFVLVDGFSEAMARLAECFDCIVVVTNQAGIGKGLMTEADLSNVHAKLYTYTNLAGGRIDGIYYCPHTKNAGCDCRKPAPGMAWQAKADFPAIDFQHAWMVGDSVADLLFGQGLGMQTILITGKAEEIELVATLPTDAHFDSLLDCARFFSTRHINR